MSADPNSEADLVKQEDLPEGVILREHVVDGIQEYDQRLPMWWLIILFGVMAYSVIYWLVLDDRSFSGGVHDALESKLEVISSARLANSIDVTNNDLFWKMADNASFVSAGKASYESNCIACHGADMKGGIGFNLIDDEWIHGATPAEIYVSISAGFPDKGMLPWENILGQKRISEVVAYVLNRNPGIKP
jgi:cytochrome c oxidase cbb3-type subunit 3